jgi:COMPASS component SPP1
VSNFGTVAPIEPSPSADRSQAPHSPTTLDQYHHGSKSPEEHLRRQSIFSESSSAPKLAPIQSLTGALSEKINGQPTRANSYGQDTSSHVQRDNSTLNNIAQSHGAGFPSDTPVTSQTREPSPPKDQNQVASDKPRLEMPRQPSPLSHIKTEHSPTPASTNETGAGTASPTMPNGTQQGTPPADDMDPETRKLVEQLKNEHGVRAARGKSSIDSIPAFEPPPAKKRTVPKGASAAATKKGVAKKPPAKKRKVEDANNAGSPGPGLKSNSPTPSAVAHKKKGSKSKDNTPALGSSPPAVDESMMDDGEEDGVSVASGDDVYCICRKGDDHSWMIACDGGCEDWFHGKCVKIREEDGDLIDRYICPNCEKKGAGVTTWKPMCRREGCRKPARVSKSNASKYCSDACGEMFMAGMVDTSNTQAGGAEADKKRSPKNRRKSNYTDNIRNSFDESDDEDMGPRGGPLRPGEIKALATCVNDVASFRNLGDGVLSPPPTASPEGKFPNGAFESAAVDADAEIRLPLSYTLQPSETQRINSIAEEKDILRKRRQILKDKEKFVSMTRDQAQHYAERESIKIKDVCGYDRRLGWDEHEFERWRKSKSGIAAFRLETLDPAENEEEEVEGADESTEEPKVDADADGDVQMVDGDSEAKDKEWFCAKKRCERHKGWQKLAIHDVRAAESELANEMRKFDKEEREIRERAMLRWRKELGGKGDEGTVEAVG